MGSADDSIIQQITALVEEEHQLYGKSDGGAPLSDEDESRLRELEVRLDQCWDLLRQRRARRSAGLDPDDVRARPADVVEHYQQ
jgi:hypothetical protein